MQRWPFNSSSVEYSGQSDFYCQYKIKSTMLNSVHLLQGLVRYIHKEQIKAQYVY